jgi:hypothetical protein
MRMNASAREHGDVEQLHVQISAHVCEHRSHFLVDTGAGIGIGRIQTERGIEHFELAHLVGKGSCFPGLDPKHTETGGGRDRRAQSLNIGLYILVFTPVGIHASGRRCLSKAHN